MHIGDIACLIILVGAASFLAGHVYGRAAEQKAIAGLIQIEGLLKTSTAGAIEKIEARVKKYL